MQDLVLIKLEAIQPNPFQPRKTFDEKLLKELADSIESQGLHQPIIVRPIENSNDLNIKYEIVAGERRWRAHKLLGVPSIQAIVKNYTDQSSIEAAITENLQRKDLTAYEEATSFKQFMDILNLNTQQIATRLGKSRSYIANTVRILKLPEQVLNLVADNKLDKWHCLHLLNAPTPEIQIEIAYKAVQGEWNVLRLKKEIENSIEVTSILAEANTSKTENTSENNGAETEQPNPQSKKEKTFFGEGLNPNEKHFILVQAKNLEGFENLIKILSDSNEVFYTGKSIKKISMTL